MAIQETDISLVIKCKRMVDDSLKTGKHIKTVMKYLSLAAKTVKRYEPRNILSGLVYQHSSRDIRNSSCPTETIHLMASKRTELIMNGEWQW